MAFAGHLGVAKSFLTTWAAEHEEFAYAMDVAQNKRLAFWESELRNNSKSYQPTFIKMILENSRSDQWRTTKALEHEAGVSTKINVEQKVAIVEMSSIELMNRLDYQLAALEQGETVNGS